MPQGEMRSYFTGKLFEINYRMAIHEGDANHRLASESIKILLLPPNEVPDTFKKDFIKLRQLIEETIKNTSAPGLIPIRIKKIQNRTASKYIKLLIDIEYQLRT
jgi:hypothetical protein